MESGWRLFQTSQLQSSAEGCTAELGPMQGQSLASRTTAPVLQRAPSLSLCAPQDPEQNHSLQRGVHFGFLKQFQSSCLTVTGQHIIERASDQARITLCGASTRCSFQSWLQILMKQWWQSPAQDGWPALGLCSQPRSPCLGTLFLSWMAYQRDMTVPINEYYYKPAQSTALRRGSCQTYTASFPLPLPGMMQPHLTWETMAIRSFNAKTAVS